MKATDFKMETIYILFRNKDKNFAIDRITFTGKNSFDDAVNWGKSNLENFNLDMICYE